MRAVLVGLVGAVLAVGGAGAGDLSAGRCLETQATFQAAPAQYQGPQKVGRPELIGRQFRVVRVLGASKKWDQLVLLSDGREQYVLGLNIAPHAVPGSYYASWSPNDPKRPRVSKSSKPEITEGGQYAFWVHYGPLSGLELDTIGCSA